MHGEPDSRGSEGMSDGETSSPQVELAHVHGPGLLLPPHHVLAEFVAVHGLVQTNIILKGCIGY